MNGKKLLTLSVLALLLVVGCKTGNSSSSEQGTSSSSSSEASSSSSSSSSEDSVSSNDSFNNLDSSEPTEVVQGQVGKLTSDMIAAIGNESITVEGTLTDYYSDGENGELYTTEYFSEVKMSNGAWSGTYWITPEEGEKVNKTTDAYRRGEVVNDGTNEGAALDKVYINKNNIATTEHEVLYDGTPVFWANNHLWNHLNQLNINKFSVDSTNSYYEYSIDPESSTDYSADQYLMTYLAVSLSPLYSTTDGVIDTLYVYCDETKITKIEMYTQPTVISTDEDGNPVDQSWVFLSFTFSEIGTTTAGSISPYEAGIHNDKLANAINQMKGIKNYTFHATETTTSAPVGDSGDYVIESVDQASARKARRNAVINHTDNKGTVGRKGYVTEDAILYEDTGKYDYAMDDNIYHISYSGLKQNENNTYDEFACVIDYNSDPVTSHLEGKRQYIGNIFDKQPAFDIAPEIFEFDGGSMDKYGNFLYRFTLRDSTIAYQVAPQISSHSYADDATSSVASKFSILVDDKGNFVSTSFPYDLVSGTYLGVVKTTYSNIGTTTLPAGTFDGYVGRNVQKEWSQYGVMDYYETGSSFSRVEKPVTEVISSMYGESASKFITPEDITSVFGDCISGPWHDKNQKRDANGEYIEGEYYDEFSFNIQSHNLDKNSRITDWEELMAKIGERLKEKGYQRSPANCTNRLNTKFETFVNGDIMIVFENIGYKTIYVTCYVTGNWTLNR